MDKPRVLSYARPATRVRAQLVRNDDGFELAMPPLAVWRIAISTALVAVIAVMLIVVPNLPIAGRTDVMSVVGALIGTALLVKAADLFSSRRDWAVLTVRSGTLTLSSGHLFGRSERSYALSEYKEATTNAPESRGNLVLVDLNGNEKLLLLGQIFSLTDLNIAAREIRTAIKRLDPEYVRQELELDVRLKELRDALPDAPAPGFTE